MLASRTARRIEDWHERGLIDAATAQALSADIAGEGETRSFTSIAIWLGIVCLAFGAMTFMAANWDEMSRFLRMAVLMSGTLVSYIVAAVLHRRGNTGIAEAFVLLGCGIFGAAVMLTGQMYHLSGPPEGGVFLWGLGTFIAAIATGSQGALALAVILSALWTGMAMTTGSGAAFHPWYIPVWAVLAATIWWVRARWVAHLCGMALLVWIGVSVVRVVIESESFDAGYVSLMAGFAILSCIIASAHTVRALRGFEGAAALYAMALVFGMITLLYMWREVEFVQAVSLSVMGVALPLAALALWPVSLRQDRFDHVLAAVWIVVTVLVAHFVSRGVPYAVEGYALAVSIWTIRMGGRQGWSPVTILGYAAFAVTMFVIYAAAAHGLLGTSFFYLGAGALLLIGALVVPRVIAIREGAR